MPRTRMLALRQWLARMFEDREPRNPATRIFNALLATLIIVNVAGVILESVEALRSQFFVAFETLERVATAIFAAEYVLRVWAAVDFRDSKYRDPFWGRLRYVRSFFAVVDLVAVLPSIIGVLGAADLRVLRLIRLLRMLKLMRHSTTFGLLWSVLREEAQSILALLFILLLTVTISGSLMYLIEGEEQPSVFTSIPAAMWWAIETLTTVGYGDMVPVTFAGRLLGGIVSIVGIGTLALFSGLITIGFLDQLKLHRGKVAATSAVDLENLAELPPAHAAVPDTAPDLQVCPHCGIAFSAAISH